MPIRARIYIAIVTVLGGCALAEGIFHWESQNAVRYLCYAAIALAASRLKVPIPCVKGAIPMNFLFIVVGVVDFSVSETMALGCAIVLVECIRRPARRPPAAQVVFNVAGTAVGIRAASFAYLAAPLEAQPVLTIAVAAACFFLFNTLTVALVIALSEAKSFKTMWKECAARSYPGSLAGTVLANLFHFSIRFLGWAESLVFLPLVYVMYHSYRVYLGRLDDEKQHAQDVASLHLRTIEALALAVEAKDQFTSNHLHRVQVYALEIGKELGLDHQELEALRTAALLHDIGKLAVPEHILSKPGKLSPEEFDRMKIHPVVGAEILERVRFSYPVVPIVLSHHERWDGAGYPNGLKQEEIPIGARVLAAVDCLDALATDRKYRRARPLHEAIHVVISESGKAYDPKIVEILARRYLELDRLAQQRVKDRGSHFSNLNGEGGVPEGGLVETTPLPPAVRKPAAADFLSSIAAARQEGQELFELAQDLGNSLSLDETLSVLAVRLKRIAPFDSMAIYILREQRLVPEYVSGDNFRLFSSLEIPVGQGLSGLVAENCKPVVNGNPSLEPGYPDHPEKLSTLRSALSVPLEGLNGVIGVLTLYHREPDAFTRDHLRVLLAITSKVSMAIENALKYRQAETSATTDYLTGLPNARSLFLHLDSELARCRRSDSPLAVLVCDLDGFKAINDRIGHIEANNVLRQIASGLEGACRPYDYVARMGGDEFVLVLPGMRTDDVHAAAKRLAIIATQCGRWVCKAETLAMSIGVAHYPDDGQDAEQLLAAADRRMYTVKQQHRVLADTSEKGSWSAGIPRPTIH